MRVHRTIARVALANGQVFHGLSFGAQVTRCGELIFNTAMTGYQEILSDPSYAQQMIVFTAAHVGVVGCRPSDQESDQPRALGCVLSQLPGASYHADAEQHLDDYLIQHGIPGIAQIDTRALTRMIRDQGCLAACLSADDPLSDHALIQKAQQFVHFSPERP